MRIALTLPVAGVSAAELEAQIAFHVQAGVTTIVVADRGAGDEGRAVLEAHSATGVVQPAVGLDHLGDEECRTSLAQLAILEHGAEWVLDASPGEFYWPRARSLEHALVGIPPRYTVVQALLRPFAAGSTGSAPIERSAVAARSARCERGRWLRPVYRADASLALVPRGLAAEDWRVPLRAWYPIELFQVGARVDREEEIVHDVRLRDALARIEATGELEFEVPGLVEDAEYAAECARLGEADLAPLERYVEELELRIAALEAGVGPMVRRLGRRLLRRS